MEVMTLDKRDREALRWIAAKGGRTQSLPMTKYGDMPAEALNALVEGGFLEKVDPILSRYTEMKPWWRGSVWQITEQGRGQI